MQTLSYGYLLPQNPDTGDIVFPALEFDIQRLNDHTHDGSNSAPLASKTANIPFGSWTPVAGIGGLYEQTVSVPAGLNYDTMDMWFRLSTGEFVYPSVTRVSSSQFKVQTNDNTLTYVAFCR